jgi:archaellum component FlaC
MVEKVENLILERLKRIDQRLEGIEGNVSELKTRATAVDEHIGDMFITLSGVNARLDRIDDRMKRIERRLDLSEVS